VIRFRLRVFQENGNWFFRWDNLDVPTMRGLTGPLQTRNEAESARHKFTSAETKKRPWVTFESE
jgi:hypothetical protein